MSAAVLRFVIREAAVHAPRQPAAIPAERREAGDCAAAPTARDSARELAAAHIDLRARESAEE